MRTYPLLLDGCNNRGNGRSNPWIAGVLSIVPGLGQMYNGQDVKGLLLLNAAIVNALAVVIGVLFELSLHRPDFATATLSQWCDLLRELATVNVSTMFIALMICCSGIYGVIDAVITAATRTKPHDSFDEGRFRDAVRCSSLIHFMLILGVILFLRCHAAPPEPVSIETSVDNSEQFQERLNQEDGR